MNILLMYRTRSFPLKTRYVSQYIYSDYLKDVQINHSFDLKPATYDEVAEIIPVYKG